MYDYDTDNFLHNEIEQAKRYRLEQESKLAGHQTNVDKCRANIANVDRRLADLEQLLSFHKQRDEDGAVEAFVDVADAERYTLREEYVNAPDFKPGDLVNVCEPGHKHFGVRGSIIGFVYDPDGVVVEYDNLGNTFTVPASSLMHYSEFVKQPQEYFDEAEAADVRAIHEEMALEGAGVESRDEL